MTPEAQALLTWYDAHRRDLPWRGISDPYRIWVSEIMLQQTRVETVLPYYRRFTDDYPDVAALASAEEGDVLKHWEGLGYYSRARNLLAGARQIAAEHGGAVPSDPAVLRKIKGIGDYTSGAIRSIAFGQKAAAVDGNVIRVITRLKGITENAAVPSVRREIAAQTEALMPDTRPGDFNQALMDLGATVCVPGTPDCGVCPLAPFCAGLAEDIAEDLPVLPDKKPPVSEDWDVLLVRCGRRMMIRRRTEALLRGLWIFPMLPGHRRGNTLRQAAEDLTGFPLRSLKEVGEARHVFTHRIWQMRIWHAETSGEALPEGWQWADAEEIRTLPFPTAMKKAREEALRRLTDTAN
ncbi:MAG: A/G-specific adenine glycosylase [Clostridia bacterium]|nr:A/G-specific adenine glycosylase [Clostridia bacterium]